MRLSPKHSSAPSMWLLALVAIALATGAGPAKADWAAAIQAESQGPQSYGWGWPLELPGEDGIWQVELSPEIHSVLVDPARRDVSIFDATGQPLPMGRMAEEDISPREQRWVPLPLFSLPRRPDTGAIDVRLHVERSADRSLHRIDAEVAPLPDGLMAVDHLLDASRTPGLIEALRLGWSNAEGDKKARFAVEASEDLEHWHVLLGSTTVLELHEEDRILQRREIRLPRTRSPHLRLRALDTVGLPSLQVEALLVPDAPKPLRHWLEAAFVGGELLPAGKKPARAIYTFDVPLANIEAMRLQPVEGAALAEVVAESQSPDRADVWFERARFTLVHLETESAPGRPAGQPPATQQPPLQPQRPLSPGMAQGEPVAFGPSMRRWRIEVSPPLDGPPRLQVAIVPDRYVFLRQGEGPWTLAAGSQIARSRSAPVARAVDEMRQRAGATWQPPKARPGAAVELGGPAAVAVPHRALPWKTWLLWLVLVGGAGAVALLAFQLLRRSSAPTGPS